MILAAWVVAAALAAQAPQSHAPAHRTYVQGSVLWSVHPAMREQIHRIYPNLGGSAATLTINAGAFVSSTIAVEGELVYGGNVSAPQTFHYTISNDYIAAVRDILVSGQVRFRGRNAGRLEGVLGAGWANSRYTEQSVVYYGFDQIRHPDRDYVHVQNAFTFGGGVDVVLPSAAHVAVIPGIRVRWVERPSSEMGSSYGMGPFVIEFGAGIRIW